jgi:iron complex transport system substrate-binding protein
MTTRLTTLLAALRAALLLAACAVPVTTPVADATSAPDEEAGEEASKEAADNDKATAFVDGFPVTLTDALGREVTLLAPPERVVALYNDAYGHMATLGMRPVATLVNPEMQRDEVYYFEGGLSIPTVADMDGSPDPEIVASYEPDLIIAWNEEEARMFDGIAPVLSLEPFDGIEGPKEALRGIAVALGLSERAEARITEFEARIAAYAAMVPSRPTVLKLSASGENEFWFGTVGDPVCPLLGQVVTCEWENAPGQQWGYQGTLEQVLSLDPNVIILNNWTEASTEEFLAQIEANPLWAEIRAVQEGRVVFLPEYSNPIYSSIASGEKALDTLIPAIFPETFPDGPLTDEQVQEILAEGQ